MSVHYVHLGEHRRSVVLPDDQAEKAIGQRLIIGFTAWSRRVATPSGGHVNVVAFQSEITGKAWAVYTSEEF